MGYSSSCCVASLVGPPHLSPWQTSSQMLKVGKNAPILCLSHTPNHFSNAAEKRRVHRFYIWWWSPDTEVPQQRTQEMRELYLLKRSVDFRAGLFCSQSPAKSPSLSRTLSTMLGLDALVRETIFFIVFAFSELFPKWIIVFSLSYLGYDHRTLLRI